MRILITGISGFLGWHLYKQAPSDAQLTGVAHTRQVRFTGCSVVSCSLTEEKAWLPLLHKVQPQVVIHAAALSDANRCEQNPDLSLAVNVTATHLLAEWCSKLGIRLIFCSSDLVFDGKLAPYAEEDSPHPVSTYGRHKQFAEMAVLQAGNHLVARLPLMYGDNGPVSRNMLSGILQALREGRPITLFTDEFRTPAYGGDVADGLYKLIHAPAGVYHLGGPERLSRYDIGQKVALHFGFESSLLQKARQCDVDMPAARPPDVSLVSHKATNYGFAPRPMDVVLPILAERHARGAVVL